MPFGTLLEEMRNFGSVQSVPFGRERGKFTKRTNSEIIKGAVRPSDFSTHTCVRSFTAAVRYSFVRWVHGSRVL